MLLMFTITPSLSWAVMGAGALRPLCEHLLRKGLGAGKGAENAHPKDALPGGQIQFQRGRHDHHGRAVHEDVHPPMLLHRGGDQRLALGRICDVCLACSDRCPWQQQWLPPSRARLRR